MIHVIENWYIEPDELNWQSFIYEPSQKTGNMTKKKINYHHDLWRAVLRIIEDLRKESARVDDTELSEAVANLRRFQNSYEQKIISAIQIAVKENKGSKML